MVILPLSYIWQGTTWAQRVEERLGRTGRHKLYIEIQEIINHSFKEPLHDQHLFKVSTLVIRRPNKWHSSTDENIKVYVLYSLKKNNVTASQI